jgi:regulator of protease activity HflC (stomatin/prohibitin superfamily)
MASVSTGNTGVVTTFGKVEDYTLEAGFHIKAPWHTVIEMDNRVQKTTLQLSCFSSDIQEVSMSYTLNYQIDKANAQEIYKTIGKDYYLTIVEPNIAEAVKVATAQFTAEQLVQTRSDLAENIESLLETNLSKYNIKVSSTAIEDMDFTDAFTNAVEAKQVAEQRKKQAEIEQAQALAQAENDKKIAETNAKANAEVAKIQAEADMEVAKIGADSAEYQGRKEASIALQRLASINGWTVELDEETGLNKLYKPDGSEVTAEELAKGAENLIQYYYTQQWDGKLPETVLGQDTNTLIGIGK